MPAFFLESMWRRVRKPKISTTTTPMANHDKGTAVERVSKMKVGVDVPEIWAMAPTENNTIMTMHVRMREKLFIDKGF